MPSVKIHKFVHWRVQFFNDILNCVDMCASIFKTKHKSSYVQTSLQYYEPRYHSYYGRSQWPRGLRRRSAAARLLRSWVRIPPGTWMFVCCECCVLSGRGLCDELITRPEESYRLWCVVVCDLETSIMRRPWPALGRSATGKKKKDLNKGMIKYSQVDRSKHYQNLICT